MRDSNLIDTIFHGANLQGADLSGATMFDTVFRRVDLSEVRGLDTVIHYGPSTIGLDTLLRSRGRISPAFLVGTGVPLEAVPGLLDWARKYGTRPDYYSAFISYGGPDEQFALRLHRALRTRGVETFVFAEHAGPGMKLYEVMSRYVNEYDRILIVCSRNSLVRPGVMNELDEALRREAREGGSSLVIPIALDDYVFSEWDPEQEAIGRALRDRVIGDFRTATDDQKAFLAQVDRLVQVLRKPQKGR
jgi:hypothetical protein